MTRSAGCSLLSLLVPNCSLNSVFARLLGSVSIRLRQFALYLRASCLTVGICRSWLIMVLGTYRGASLLLCVALLTGIALVSLDLSSMQLPIAGFRKSRLVLGLLYRLGVCFQVITEICDRLYSIRSVVWIRKNKLDVTFCIIYFSSNSCSTCFGQPCAHDQELTTV